MNYLRDGARTTTRTGFRRGMKRINVPVKETVLRYAPQNNASRNMHPNETFDFLRDIEYSHEASARW